MKKAFAIICILAIMASLFAGCAGSSSSADSSANSTADSSTNSSANEQLKFGISLDSVDSGFWISTLNELKRLSEETNIELVQVVAEGDANKQNQQVADLIAQGCKAIIIGANDGKAIATAIKKARDAGVYTITYSRLAEGDPDLQVLSEDVESCANMIDYLVEKAKEANALPLQLALPIGSLKENCAVGRREGHLKGIERNKENINLIMEIPTEWNHDMCLAGVQNAVQAHPEISAIPFPADDFMLMAETVLKANDKWFKVGEPGHVFLSGFDGSVVAVRLMEEGYLDGTICSDTKYMSEVAWDWAYKMSVEGEMPPQAIIHDPGIFVTRENWLEVRDKVWGYPLYLEENPS